LSAFLVLLGVFLVAIVLPAWLVSLDVCYRRRWYPYPVDVEDFRKTVIAVTSSLVPPLLR